MFQMLIVIYMCFQKENVMYLFSSYTYYNPTSNVRHLKYMYIRQMVPED